MGIQILKNKNEKGLLKILAVNKIQIGFNVSFAVHSLPNKSHIIKTAQYFPSHMLYSHHCALMKNAVKGFFSLEFVFLLLNFIFILEIFLYCVNDCTKL